MITLLEIETDDDYKVVQTHEINEHRDEDVRPESIVITWRGEYDETDTLVFHPVSRLSNFDGCSNTQPNVQAAADKHVDRLREQMRLDQARFETAIDVHRSSELYCRECGGRLSDRVDPA